MKIEIENKYIKKVTAEVMADAAFFAEENFKSYVKEEILAKIGRDAAKFASVTFEDCGSEIKCYGEIYILDKDNKREGGEE